MNALLALWTGLVYLFLYLPIGVIVLFSFSQGRVLALPIRGWTLDWYRQALGDDRLRSGLITSLEVAAAATGLALVLGSLGAFALQRYRIPGRPALRTLVVLPIILPGILTGVAMLSGFAALDIPLGLTTVIAGHVTIGLPVVLNTVAARVARLPHSLEEAAADLGATPWQTFWQVVFPNLRSALIAGGLLAFTLSFDEIIVTLFLTGEANTLPMEIWARLRFGMTPAINATVSLILGFSLALALISQRLAPPLKD